MKYKKTHVASLFYAKRFIVFGQGGINTLQVAEINEQISHLSKVFSKIVLERSLLESKLFPVNAYICVGFYQCYDQLYSVMKQVWDRITPRGPGKKEQEAALARSGTLDYLSLALLFAGADGGNIQQMRGRPFEGA